MNTSKMSIVFRLITLQNFASTVEKIWNTAQNPHFLSDHSTYLAEHDLKSDISKNLPVKNSL